MNNAPAMVNGGINERVQGAAVFCLNVEGLSAHLNIGVESRTHRAARILLSPRDLDSLKNSSPGTFIDRALAADYYSSAANMSGNYLDNYGSLLLMFLLAAGLSGALIVVSALVGQHKRSREKDQPYECGILPTGDARTPISVHFYLVALLFILFDIEAIFLYPWALVYHELKVFGFVEMLLYIIILFAGYISLWKKGALDWNR